MKKNILLITMILIMLLTTACATNTVKNEATEPNQIIQPEFGDAVELEKVAIFDENNKPYTAENLPNDCKNKDFDSDGLKNEEEIKYETNMYKVDTDGDGISDFDEIKSTKTDPTKWSSRDDGVSDLEYSIVNQDGFKEGYTATDANGFKVYLAKPEDRLYVISKVHTNVFDNLETISEAFQIKYFSGKVALNCSKYTEEVANSIAIYKISDGKAIKIETVVTADKLVEFELHENDIFVVVYEERNG